MPLDVCVREGEAEESNTKKGNWNKAFSLNSLENKGEELVKIIREVKKKKKKVEHEFYWKWKKLVEYLINKGATCYPY